MHVEPTNVPVPLAKLDSLPVYKPGKSAEATMAQYGLSFAAKLSSNENPYGPLPAVVDAIAAAAHSVNRYPDSNSTELKAALCAHVGVEGPQLTVASGSSGVLLQTLNAYAGPGDEVIFGWRSFEAYPIFTRVHGATDVMVPLRGFDIDLEAIAAAVTDRTKVILLANPNNPTGTALKREALDRFLDTVPGRVLVVLDEAYREFIHSGATPDGVETYVGRPNVLISRTLSKAYGLAGMRMGYAVSTPEIIAALDKVAPPFSLTNVAQAAAIAAIGCEKELRERVAIINSERDRIVSEIRAMGLAVPESHANLVWLPAGARTTELFEAMESKGVVARAFVNEGVRVSVGAPEENNLMLRALKEAAERIDLASTWITFE
jgi:histidinol-phosphate aminotransferase